MTEEVKEKPKEQAEPKEPEPPGDYGYVPPLFREPVRPEPLVDEEPLRPLEPVRPDFAEAMDRYFRQSVEPPDLDEFYGPVVAEEELQTAAPRLRPVAARPQAMAPSSTVCPKGFAGMCLICSEAPCDYWKKRVLRAVWLDYEYGEKRSP